MNLREHVIQAAEKEGKIPGCPSLTGSRQYSQVPRGEVEEMEEPMKRKSMIVAVLMASMLLGACGKQAETNGEKDPVVTEAPTEEATLEAEEPAGNDTKTEESAEVIKGLQIIPQPQVKQIIQIIQLHRRIQIKTKVKGSPVRHHKAVPVM